MYINCLWDMKNVLFYLYHSLTSGSNYVCFPRSTNCRAGSSANNRALMNFEYLSIYLSMCVRFGMQSIPGPAHFAFHACNRTRALASLGQLKLMSSVHADRETELLVILRETYFPEAQHGEQESPERRYAS